VPLTRLASLKTGRYKGWDALKRAPTTARRHQK
jgi:hypothetical protein